MGVLSLDERLRATAMNQTDFGNISVVLVNTSHPGNIGASARAMKNMGLSKLALVGPKEFPSGVAIGRAASAVEILDRASVVDSLAEAVADCGLVIGASARSRRITWPLLTPAECGRRAAAEAGKHPVALVFGREDTGLSNEELQLCHYHVRIPTNPEYPSLNLAAAVMVICYELRRAVEADEAGDETLEREWDQPLATAHDLERFYSHLEQVLVAVDFHNPENPRQLMQRLRRLFGRIRIDTMEMNILRGMLGHIEQELKTKR